MSGRRGVVSIDGARVGVIEETETGTKFTYDAEWCSRPGALAVSLTLAVRPEPYESRALHPFFENLLPEGWLLDLVTLKLKVHKDDTFGLLLATCADCIGAVEVRPDEGAAETP